ncbi:anaphase promoting complex subunit 8 [Lipomyces japonicus]|uniref:anaphase promoting complex subunit 8 n=1 Tax=Lipomyces japonicus TaxID=56871 RepID=UPI0034CD20C4
MDRSSKIVNSAYTARLQRDLEQAFTILSERCLYESAKWTAEALNGVENVDTDVDVMEEEEGEPDVDLQSFKLTDHLTAQERRRYALAKSCFDCREYDRAATFLENSKNPKCLFLKLYARYISGEKKKEEQSEVILGPLDGEVTPNKQLVEIISELTEYFTTTNESNHDPFLLYLYGIVLIKHKCEKQAIEPLIRSVNIYPFNWGAWLELASCIPTIDKMPAVLSQIWRQDHIMTKIFEAFTFQELFQSTDAAFAMLGKLELVLPNFLFLKIQRAMLCYHALEYAESEKLFDFVLNADPHRLDDMDMYSNILYVTEQRAKLAYVAQLASITDKFRPETCCIIANYYSLKSEHEKAVMYYRRALTLNRNCLGAWTLMGHEYVELKNIRAAIESYRCAISVNSKDVRAWYGLGQAYEVIEMYYYSFFYYQRAAALKPYDHRMWIALASCFEKLQQPTKAIKAYQRALSLSDNEPSILSKLSSLANAIGDVDSADKYASMQNQAEEQKVPAERSGLLATPQRGSAAYVD